MQEMTKTVYKCEHCKVVYESEEKALACENFGKFFDSVHSELPTNCWYKLRWNNLSERICFITSISYSGNYSLRCLDRYIHLISGESNSYYVISPISGWTYVSTYSIKQAYDNFKILPLITNIIDKGISEVKYNLEKEVVKSKLEELQKLSVEEVLDNAELVRSLLKDEYSQSRRNFKL